MTKGGPGSSTLLASVYDYTIFEQGHLGLMAAYGFLILILINIVVLAFLNTLYRTEKAAARRRCAMTSVYTRAINILAVLVVVVWLIPVLWVALTSVKPTNVINAPEPTFYSFEPTGEHYVEIFDRFLFDRAIVNSLITVGVSTLIVMILALPAAYAVARMGLMGGDTWALVILSLRFMPGVVVVLPYFKMANWFGLIDTQIVLIVVYVAFGLPFAVWILRGFLLDCRRRWRRRRGLMA